jgi:hypothetical protein
MIDTQNSFVSLTLWLVSRAQRCDSLEHGGVDADTGYWLTFKPVCVFLRAALDGDDDSRRIVRYHVEVGHGGELM